MNKWQERFSQKLGRVRNAARDQFEQAIEGSVTPVFEEFREFTTQQGFCATAPVSKTGIRTFKFAMTENAYVLVTFRVAGFEHCETQSELFVPGKEKEASTPTHVELNDMDVGWTRRIFERTLDRFVDAFVNSMSSAEETIKELAGA